MSLSLYTSRESTPSPQDSSQARISGERLARYAAADESLAIRILDAEPEKPLELPPGAVALLVRILDEMAAGRGISLILDNTELTTVQAAALLNVSRPYLIKLLTEGVIPYRRVGRHRRIRMDDVAAYKNSVDRERDAVLDELTAEAQAQGMGYAG